MDEKFCNMDSFFAKARAKKTDGQTYVMVLTYSSVPGSKLAKVREEFPHLELDTLSTETRPDFFTKHDFYIGICFRHDEPIANKLVSYLELGTYLEAESLVGIIEVDGTLFLIRESDIVKARFQKVIPSTVEAYFREKLAPLEAPPYYLHGAIPSIPAASEEYAIQPPPEMEDASDGFPFKAISRYRGVCHVLQFLYQNGRHFTSDDLWKAFPHATVVISRNKLIAQVELNDASDFSALNDFVVSLLAEGKDTEVVFAAEHMDDTEKAYKFLASDVVKWEAPTDSTWGMFETFLGTLPEGVTEYEDYDPVDIDEDEMLQFGHLEHAPWLHFTMPKERGLTETQERAREQIRRFRRPQYR